jgi:hypothetical protein
MSRYLRYLTVAAAACAAAGVLPAAAAVAGTPATGGLTIHAVLGGGHLSPYAGQDVSGVPGVVTDVTSSGFYMQDAKWVGGRSSRAPGGTVGTAVITWVTTWVIACGDLLA